MNIIFIFGRSRGSRISPHEKRATCSGNQYHTTPFTKIWYLVDKIVFQQREKQLALLLKNRFQF
ncbi:hypothetical protein AN960_02995 [Bacillus sp. FJAT-25509]|nr:hypothetical protein AN960_02995 [Bacillus sp. FJAT-25509]